MICTNQGQFDSSIPSTCCKAAAHIVIRIYVFDEWLVILLVFALDTLPQSVILLLLPYFFSLREVCLFSRPDVV